MVARPIVVHNNFQEGSNIIRIKIGHLEGENKWGSSGSLYSNKLDVEGLKAAQRNELAVPDNITFPQREGLSEWRQLRHDAYISGLGLAKAIKAFSG